MARSRKGDIDRDAGVRREAVAFTIGLPAQPLLLSFSGVNGSGKRD